MRRLKLASVVPALLVLAGCPADPKIMGFIEAAEHAVQSALAAVQETKAGIDPSKLKPIDPVAQEYRLRLAFRVH